MKNSIRILALMTIFLLAVQPMFASSGDAFLFLGGLIYELLACCVHCTLGLRLLNLEPIRRRNALSTLDNVLWAAGL